MIGRLRKFRGGIMAVAVATGAGNSSMVRAIAGQKREYLMNGVSLAMRS
jgi:hypothetical protein